MAEMTSRERFQRMLEHWEADRIPMLVYPWMSTLDRWRGEGMPADAELCEKIPPLMESGGCISASDHSIPCDVSLEDYRRIIALVKEIGTY